MRRPFLDRFWARVDMRGGPTACWPWRGARTGGGYGAVDVRRRGPRRIIETAHRLAYELHHRAPIPAVLTVDHLCRVRHCVNPAHLELVTRGENVLRGIGPPAQHARATTCIRGHPFDAGNTYRTPTGGRTCRLCQRARNREYARRRARRIDAPRPRALHGPPRG